MNTGISKQNLCTAFCVLGLVVILLFGDVLFFGRTVSPLFVPGMMGGGAWGFEGHNGHKALIDPGGSFWGPRPHTVLVGDSYKSGRLPLWNPWMGTGQPLAANMDSVAFSPLRIPLYLNPSPFMWDLFDIARIFLAGFFAYVFFRSVGLASGVAIFSSVLFMLSGYIIFNIDMHHLDVEMLLPLVLFCFEMLHRRRGALFWVLASSAAVFMTVVGGQPESTFLVLGFGYLYFLARALFDRDGRGLSSALPEVLALALANILGFAFSAFLLLPFYEFMQAASSNHEVSVHHKPGLFYNPYLCDFVSFVVPYFMGPIHEPWLKDYSWHTLARGHVGVVAMFFALSEVVALVSRRKAWNCISVFFAVILALMLAKFYGAPFVNWIGNLPLSSMIIYGKYMGPLIALSFAALAGLGLERLSREKEFGLTVRLPAKLIILLSAGTYLYFLMYMQDRADIMKRIPHRIFQTFSLPVITLIQVAAAVLLVLVVVAILKYYARAAWFKAGMLVAVFTCLAAVELALYVPNPGLKKGRNRRYDMFTKAPYLDFLKANLGCHRVIGVDRILYPDFGSAFEVGDLRVLDGLLVKRYMEWISAFFTTPRDRFTADEGVDFEDLGVRRTLDILGVKYILRGSSHEKGLAEDILGRGRVISAPDQDTGKWVNRSRVALAGQDKEVLFEHAPACVEYPITVPAGAVIRFSMGLVPGAWSPEKGDGVRFVIALRDEAGEKVLFSKEINPKQNEADRKWHDESVGLEEYAGRQVTLSFQTQAGPVEDNQFDWAVWGDLRLDAAGGKRHELVYDKEIKILENRTALPRAFLASGLRIVRSSKDFFALLRDESFDPRTAVMCEEDAPPAVIDLMASMKGPAGPDPKIESYEADRVLISAEAARPGMLVLSDTFYPGWKAFVDGKPAKIFRVDQVLRGVILEAGSHKVEFAYRPASFRAGAAISLGSLGLVAVILFIRMRRRKTLPAG